MNYKITYGNTEANNTELVADYDSAVKRSEALQYNNAVITRAELESLPSDYTRVFPVDYVRIENIKTGNSMTWRSKDSMDFEGVL